MFLHVFPHISVWGSCFLSPTRRSFSSSSRRLSSSPHLLISSSHHLIISSSSHHHPHTCTIHIIHTYHHRISLTHVYHHTCIPAVLRASRKGSRRAWSPLGAGSVHSGRRRAQSLQKGVAARLVAAGRRQLYSEPSERGCGAPGRRWAPAVSTVAGTVLRASRKGLRMLCVNVVRGSRANRSCEKIAFICWWHVGSAACCV